MLLEKLKRVLLWLSFMNTDENISLHKNKYKMKFQISTLLNM